MKSHIKKIIGKTIEKVVVAKGPRDPHQQVYLLFTDGTHFEIYGDWFTCANHIEHGNEQALRNLLEGYGRTEVIVHSERGHDRDA